MGTTRCTTVASLVPTALLLLCGQAHGFTERWSSAAPGTFISQAEGEPSFTTISGDAGTWIVGDTISEFPECGQTPNFAQITTIDGSRALRVVSNPSASSCADNIEVTFHNFGTAFPDNNVSIPISDPTFISFRASGVLDSPTPANPTCFIPPCGETVFLVLEDLRATARLIYIVASDPQRPVGSGDLYTEIALDMTAQVHVRNLFEDFLTIPNFNPSNAQIGLVVLSVDQHGEGVIDDLEIGPSTNVTTTTTSTSVTRPPTTSTTMRGSTTTTTTLAGSGCAQPVSVGAGPTATDCLFILNVAVGIGNCAPACVCDVNGDSNTTATDALTCLNIAVGIDLPLACPCGSPTTT